MFKKFSAVVAAPVATLGFLVGEVHAALPAGVAAAIDDGSTDGGTLMGLLAGAGAGLYIIWKILRKAGIML